MSLRPASSLASLSPHNNYYFIIIIITCKRVCVCLCLYLCLCLCGDNIIKWHHSRKSEGKCAVLIKRKNSNKMKHKQCHKKLNVVNYELCVFRYIYYLRCLYIPKWVRKYQLAVLTAKIRSNLMKKSYCCCKTENSDKKKKHPWNFN